MKTANQNEFNNRMARIEDSVAESFDDFLEGKSNNALFSKRLQNLEEAVEALHVALMSITEQESD